MPTRPSWSVFSPTWTCWPICASWLATWRRAELAASRPLTARRSGQHSLPVPENRKTRPLVVVLATLVFWSVAAGSAVADAAPRYRLLLQITVDQLRGDVADTFRNVPERGGFAWLKRHGIHYASAHYTHLNNATAVGHASLATGAWPSTHGIVGNEWYDRGLGHTVYNSEDPSAPVFGDPDKGRSPRMLRVPTLTDAIAAAGHQRGHYYSISLKDRGAIFVAGRSGKALWYETGGHRFTSSTFYFAALPGWLSDLPLPFRLTPLERYTAKADIWLHHAVQALLDRVPFGASGVTDVLHVSYSALDYVGHRTGALSRDYLATVAQLDNLLRDLLRRVDRIVGLDRTLVVLSADHGAPPAVDELKKQGKPAGVWPQPVDTWLRDQLDERYGAASAARFVTAVVMPFVYLDDGAISRSGRSRTSVENELVRQISGLDGVFRVRAPGRLCVSEPADPIDRAVCRNFDAERSGDLTIVLERGWQVLYGSKARIMRANHGSVWPYDSHVPLFVATGRGQAQRVERPVDVVAVVPTVAELLGVKPPSGAVHAQLPEVRNLRRMPVATSP
ncbi:MAG: hypothetical protein D6761_02820 [Candidatus Dadabacteria bacterium]|nr:MAG: hypothetical protein D6761_02820 [Candidatus Dadabacteria bacterium]